MCMHTRTYSKTLTNDLVVYKVVRESLPDHMYYSMFQPHFRIPQERSGDCGTCHNYVLHKESNSPPPGFYCYCTNADAKQVVYLHRHNGETYAILACRIPVGITVTYGLCGSDVYSSLLTPTLTPSFIIPIARIVS
jgi:hypothetical protein